MKLPKNWKKILSMALFIVLVGLLGSPALLRLLNTKNVYLVPLRQDDPVKKPVSLVADFTLLPQAIALALEGKQLQPVFLPPHTGA